MKITAIISRYLRRCPDPSRDRPELASVTGGYFEGRRQIRSSDESYKDQREAELWNVSVALTAANRSPK